MNNLECRLKPKRDILSCPVLFLNLTQARVMWEEELQLRKGLQNQIAWRLGRWLSSYELIVDMGGPSPLWVVPLGTGGPGVEKKADKQFLHGLCFTFCLQVIALTSCPDFPL